MPSNGPFTKASRRREHLKDQGECVTFIEPRRHPHRVVARERKQGDGRCDDIEAGRRHRRKETQCPQGVHRVPTSEISPSARSTTHRSSVAETINRAAV